MIPISDNFLDDVSYCCYICKLGWLDEEETPRLINRRGIWVCEHCHGVLEKQDKQGWESPFRKMTT